MALFSQESIGKHGDLFIPAIVRPQKAGLLNTAPHDNKLQVLHHLKAVDRWRVNHQLREPSQETEQNEAQSMAKLVQVA